MIVQHGLKLHDHVKTLHLYISMGKHLINGNQKNLGKGKKIAPSSIWNMLSSVEKKQAQEALVQTAEEVMANHTCQNLPGESPEAFIFNEDGIH